MIFIEWNDAKLSREGLLTEERRLRKLQPMPWAKQKYRMRCIIHEKFKELKAKGKTMTNEELSVFLFKMKKKHGLVLKESKPY